MNKILLFSLILISGIAGCSNEPEIILPKVSQVGVEKAENIIKEAALQPIKTIDSTDSRDNTMKIYQFDGVHTQLEFSENYILISWHQHDKASIDKAVRLGMATLGDDAGYFIHKVDIQGQHTDYSIQGHRIINSTCISKLCAITIQRN
ncbi:hypothetical protein KNR19_14950 [Acinetobacter baumannii]|uniref:hypothetical protein n=1 Tax=Acinetobacter baumannii TaxID=470 RepID=UPI0020A50138|nr:hypothetical protein [Acinetobacter baumannii]MCO9132757.1 hypothetical protein [Acinetobacter baumannii]